MVYIKYRCLVCGNDIEEVFDFHNSRKFPSDPNSRVCEIHKPL